MATFSQAEFQIRCEWGLSGLTELAPLSDAVVGSGKELVERGFGCDVDLAAECDISTRVPRLVGRCFTGD